MMRVVKLAFLSFVILFVLITAISAFIPAHVRISKAIDITGNKDSLLHLISNRDQWVRWHPAFQMANSDSLFQKAKIVITPVLQTDSLITMNWQQPGKAPVVNGWQFHRFPSSHTVTLQWFMDFRLPWYPWQKFSSLFYEKTYGLMMDRGLQNIKNIVQEKP